MQSASRIRGSARPCAQNARTIAALTSNPGCDRRAVLDTAGVDKQRLADHIGYPARFGQSQFAIVRGNAFEAQLKADQCAALLRLLIEQKIVPPGQHARHVDCSAVGQTESQDDRLARTAGLLGEVFKGGDSWGVPGQRPALLLDHPLLAMTIAGRTVYLEPDLILIGPDARVHVVEVKSFAVIDGQAAPSKVAAAAIQAAVYVMATCAAVTEAGFDAGAVADEIVLVCPRDFANQPTATLIDVRKQLAVLRRQFARMARIEMLLAALPDDLTFDLSIDESGVARRPPVEVVAALECVPARYIPECLAVCELAGFCRSRSRARGQTAVLGRDVCERLGGIEEVETVLGLASGTLSPSPDQTETAAVLRLAEQLRSQSLVLAGDPTAASSGLGLSALGLSA
ncbi:MAG: hypothetical protein JXA67_02385 [Micromonosporaceae bacterium]|nr:hypothetical protein [Micromonosporaceae bacterium]